ncbi:MAG TPA: hypothetical protein PLK31_02360 [Chloroflexota bacterium]|nr:hypothetical protein [Chloroflexota bacterium]
MNTFGQPSERVELHQILEDQFNLTELKNLAFYIGVDYEVFSQQSLSDFARELILYCERRKRLSCLVEEILRQRHNLVEKLTGWLAKLPSCHPTAKVQVIIAEPVADLPALLAALANALRMPTEEIVLITAVRGTTRLLLQIPVTAVDFTQFSRLFSLLNGQYHVLSIQDFLFLDQTSQQVWQLAATQYPPLVQQHMLYPTISWQAAQELADDQPQNPALSSQTIATVPEHWLAQAANQTALYSISREIISQLAPGEAGRLNSFFPQYTALAQTGQVKTVRQAAQAFGLGEGVESMALIVLSVLVTAFNTWLLQQNRQTLAEFKEQAEWQSLSNSLDEALKQGRVPAELRRRIRLATDEVIPATLGDIYTPYERGLATLQNMAGSDLELLTYEQQLRENISRARRYGDSPEVQVERSAIIERLNRLAFTAVGISFNQLCNG